MRAKKAESGIRNMRRKLCKTWKRKNMFAKIAAKSFTHYRSEKKRNIVQMLAKAPQEGKAELMQKDAYAPYVGRNFMLTNTSEQKLVPDNAEIYFVGVQGIKTCGKQPVYNMEVDEYHNFSVNGGIIVHNCMDSARYYAMTMLRRKVGKEPYIPLYERW